jgi:general secretion pathway protein M
VIETLSAPTRRLLALGLLLAALLLAEMLLLAPWRDWRQGLAGRIEVAELLLARTRAATRAAEAELADAGGAAVEPVADALLQAGEETLAAAQLQTLLRTAAAAEGIRLASLQVEPASAEAGARRIGLRVSFTARFAPMLRLMHRLESGLPVLRVNGFEIQATDSSEDPELSATLAVVALMRDGGL